MNCPNCGVEVEDGACFCTECGCSLLSAETNNSAAPDPNNPATSEFNIPVAPETSIPAAPGLNASAGAPSKTKAPLIVGIVCALIIVVVLAVVLIPRGTGNTIPTVSDSTGGGGNVSTSTRVVPKVDEYAISFDGSGATGGGMRTILCKPGETVEVPTCDFTYDGFEFVRWEDENKAEYDPGDRIEASSDLELFAVWKTRTCTVSFRGGGATGGTTSSINAEYGDNITLPACGYYKDGYDFDRWESDSGSTFAPGDMFHVQGDAAFTAQWQIKTRVSSTPTPTPTATPAEKNRYEVVKKDLSWTEASAECNAKGGHLVTITSREEMNTIVAMAEQAGIDFVWLGGTTSPNGSGANGQWITGESFDYSAWHEGEPSHYDGDGTPETCMELWHFTSTGEWSWNDERDDPLDTPEIAEYMSGNMGYVCEYEN